MSSNSNFRILVADDDAVVEGVGQHWSEQRAGTLIRERSAASERKDRQHRQRRMNNGEYGGADERC